MGKQKVKSNQQAMKKLMDKSAAAEPAIGATAWPIEDFVSGADLIHAVRAVAGTEWGGPLSAVVQYLMGLRNSLLAGECALLPHGACRQLQPIAKRHRSFKNQEGWGPCRGIGEHMRGAAKFDTMGNALFGKE
jgi:hypothetical protein